MRQGQASHIRSTCTTAVQHLREIRQVAATGRSTDGTTYAALPAAQTEALLGQVDALSACLQAIADSLAESEDTTSRRGRGATRMWLNTLLYMVQEHLEDLLPERMGRRYGALSEGEAEELGGRVEAALAKLRKAFATLDT